MKTVEIFVPHDSGFASGGSGVGVNIIMCLIMLVEGFMLPFRCLFTPVKVWKEFSKNRKAKKRAELSYKAWVEENIKTGKNRDGSFTKSFPSNTTLREALAQCNLCPEYEEKNRANSVVKKIGDTPLGDLTKEQIDNAVMSCQIANW